MNTLEEVKKAQLDLLSELKRICEKHNIIYFLIEGSLIGAIRHNGFIPWDDDIDVGMFRDEYDRFIKICENELDSDYKLYNWEVDKKSPAPFLKMKIKGTHCRERRIEKTEINDEIFIDIFPIDNAPDNFLKRKIQSIQIYFMKKILIARCDCIIGDSNKIKKVLYKILAFLSGFKSIEKWKEYFTIVLKKYNTSNTNYVVNMCSSYSYTKELKKRSIFEHSIQYEFEGLNVAIPKGYHQYLKELYGDYMKLPPKEQREGKHDIRHIDLGEYEIRYKSNIKK